MKNGQLVTAKILWKNTFSKENNERFANAQRFIDSECIRLMGRYTPMRSGFLAKSPILGTKIGSGHIVYNAPYARYQYYGLVMIPVGGKTSKRVLANPKRELRYSKSRHPQAQRLWFEVMKKKHGGAILRGVAAITGGKASK